MNPCDMKWTLAGSVAAFEGLDESSVASLFHRDDYIACTCTRIEPRAGRQKGERMPMEMAVMVGKRDLLGRAMRPARVQGATGCPGDHPLRGVSSETWGGLVVGGAHPVSMAGSR